MGVVNTHDAETRMRGRRSRLHAVAKGPRTMATANDQHKTNYPTTGGFNQRQVLGRLEFHLEGHRRTAPKWITSNGMVLVCAIAILLIVIVLLELHIRTLTNHSASRRQHLGEVKLQIEGTGPGTHPRPGQVSSVPNVELLSIAEYRDETPRPQP